jgi:hypothetical protein
MKLSREFASAIEAETCERELKMAGYLTWRKQGPDGIWHVLWLLD